MTGKQKTFQKCHQTIGYHPSQPNQKHRSINWVNIIFLNLMAQQWLTTATFSVFDANSMIEYGFSFYIIIDVADAIAIYSIFIWQSVNTLKFIHNCEEFVEMSKYYFEHGFSGFCD